MNVDEEQLPEKIQRRVRLAKLFYPLDRNEERSWGKVFDSSWEDISNWFEELALKKEYTQEILADKFILWYDKKDKSVEGMFCFIDDITNFDSVYSVFNKIKEHQPLFTNAIVHQRKDGEGVYDIFRFSKFSYLEHCNRVRAPKKKGQKMKNS